MPGETREFWVWDLSVMPPGARRARARLAEVGGRSLVWLEDGETVAPAAIKALHEAFESRVASDPARGIHQIDTELFGPLPPGLDGEARVSLLLVRLDRYQGRGFDGFINPFDSLSEGEAMARHGQHSNEALVLYLNTRTSPLDSTYMLGVVAHELEHLIHQAYDPNEASWVDESLAEAAMVACGYLSDLPAMERYLAHPETPLITDGYVDYGACFLFGAYLYEQLGAPFLRRLVEQPLAGIEGLEAVIGAQGKLPPGFSDLYGRWLVANLLAHRSPADSRYGYTGPRPGPAAVRRELTAGGTAIGLRLAAFGPSYVRLDGAQAGGTLRELSGEPADHDRLLALLVLIQDRRVDVRRVFAAAREESVPPHDEAFLVAVADAAMALSMKLEGNRSGGPP